MRPERITKRNAQAVWDAIRDGVKLQTGHTLPAIDMGTIFGTRKSMTAQAVTKAVNEIITAM